MTKLQRKIKLAAKRRSHKKSVQRRKETRAEKAAEEAAERERKRLEAETLKELAEQDNDGVAAAEANKRLQGLQVQVVAKTKKTKQLTRKQARRKAKSQDKWEAIADQYDKRVGDKKARVKHRAVVRNSELQN